MSRRLPGLLAVLVSMSAAIAACSTRSAGLVCTTNADCPVELVCVVDPDVGEGLCIDPDDDHGALPERPQGYGYQLAVNRDVDILFVIDNSGSMGEAQARLAKSFAALIEELEAEDVAANYRIGFTTTDNGNPWCPSDVTTPEAGNLVLSSCKDRLAEFSLDGGLVDVQDLACNDPCTLTGAELAITPTPTDFDPEPKPRLWLESIAGSKNLPDGTDIVDALACFAPQGINGCGFESQLESMYLALKRAETADQDEFGFIRAGAVLAIVFVTDEADCSYNKSYAEIFEADGNRVFWSDPSAMLPTSAVCWNAGVECVGDPSHYEVCNPVNKGLDGNVGVSDADAVLHPMSRYFDLLDGLAQQKQEFNPGQELVVGLIGGVDAMGNAIYRDVSATDPEFQDSFGIGPGCTADPSIRAVPPVRIRELVQRYSAGNLYSICNVDDAAALGTIGRRIAAQMPPACYPQCAADSDPSTPTLEPTCWVEQDEPGPDNFVDLRECLRDADGAYVIDASTNDYAMPAADVHVCYALLTDTANLTSSTADDMSAACSELHYNLEFQIARRPGHPVPSGTSISTSCLLDPFPDVTCAGIGG